jgi:FdhD protein
MKRFSQPQGGRSIAMTQVTEWDNGGVRRVDDYLAGEEPLEMRAGRSRLGVTMRTPGHDFELTAGFLLTDGIISRPDQLVSLHGGDRSARNGRSDSNLVRIRLLPGVKFQAARRKYSAGSACGVCGKASIDEVRQRGARRPEFTSRFSPEILCELPDKLRFAQEVFGRTGGLHAAALFDGAGKLLVLREDIGRHNAVDKVIGWALLEGKIPLNGHVLLVSGRGGFEIVQKSLVAGIPLLASVSAPSSLAVQLAREMGQTLIGFLRGRRFIVYSGVERLEVSIPV